MCTVTFSIFICITLPGHNNANLCGIRTVFHVPPGIQPTRVEKTPVLRLITSHPKVSRPVLTPYWESIFPVRVTNWGSVLG